MMSAVLCQVPRYLVHGQALMSIAAKALRLWIFLVVLSLSSALLCGSRSATTGAGDMAPYFNFKY